MAETKVSDPIITFKNVSKTYTLYKDDKARFKALFFKPRNAKTNKALNNVFNGNQSWRIGWYCRR